VTGEENVQLFLPDFSFAHRTFWASLILFRAAADILRLRRFSFRRRPFPNQPASFRSLFLPRKRALAATSPEPAIRRTKFRECLEDRAGFFRDLKEALFCADDGVGAEVRDSVLSLCHSWRVSHNLSSCGSR
jgi:hypothetical protein